MLQYRSIHRRNSVFVCVCALPPETGFPLNNVRVQTDPYTQHKRDGVPPWKETKAVAMEFGHSGPSGSGG